MKYDEIRDSISTGDIFSASGTGWFGKGIRLLTGQGKSHVGMFVWLQFNGSPRRLCLIEAMEGSGVRLVPARYILETTYWTTGSRLWWHKVNGLDGKHLADFVIQHWGDGYASKYQFVVGMSRLVKYIRSWLGRSLDTDQNRWHCAELITRAAMSQGYIHTKDPAITTPGDVAEFSFLSPGVEIEPSNREW